MNKESEEQQITRLTEIDDALILVSAEEEKQRVERQAIAATLLQPLILQSDDLEISATHAIEAADILIRLLGEINPPDLLFEMQEDYRA